MTEHKIKCAHEAFDIKWKLLKPWEFRFNDRHYQVGDLLIEIEIDEHEKQTGRKITEKIKYIMFGGQFGIPNGYCIMTTQLKSRTERQHRTKTKIIKEGWDTIWKGKVFHYFRVGDGTFEKAISLCGNRSRFYFHAQNVSDKDKICSQCVRKLQEENGSNVKS